MLKNDYAQRSEYPTDRRKKKLFSVFFFRLAVLAAGLQLCGLGAPKGTTARKNAQRYTPKKTIENGQLKGANY